MVTGGFGFIGARLTEALICNGHGVRVVDNLTDASVRIEHENVEFIHASTTDYDAVTQSFEGVAACIHLAGAPTDRDPHKDTVRQGSAIGEYAKNLFSCAHRAGNVPIIYASSAAVYGVQPKGLIKETTAPHPINAHGEEKLLLENAAKEASDHLGVPSIGLRFFNLYGPTQSPTSIYCGAPRHFIEFIRAGQPLPLHGGGEQTRDFTYIDDAISSIESAITAPAQGAQIFNICTGVGTTIRELGEMMGRAANRDIVFEEEPRPEIEVDWSVGNPEKAQEALHFKAQTSLSEGIAKLVAALL